MTRNSARSVLLGVATAIVVGTVISGISVPGVSEIEASYEDHRVIVSVAFIGLTAISCMVFVPVAVLCAAAGGLAGPYIGSLLALTGLLLGACLCSLVGRLPSWATSLASKVKWVEVLLEGIARKPLHSMTFVRAVPGVPFHATSYASGIAKIQVRWIVLGTLLGFTPRCVLFVSLGATAGAQIHTQNTVLIAVSLAIAGIAGLLGWNGIRQSNPNARVLLEPSQSQNGNSA